MPTENRSSNTELVSVPCDLVRRLISATVAARGEGSPTQRDAEAFLSQPAPQPHPEPIAWMVGTAFWWTKEEAERDAAETGKTITPIGPMSGIAPAEQHQGEPEVLFLKSGYFYHSDGKPALTDETVGYVRADQITHADPGEVERLRSMFDQTDADLRSVTADRDTLRAQLAERNVLLAEIAKRHWSGVDFDLPADLAARIKDLSASA